MRKLEKVVSNFDQQEIMKKQGEIAGKHLVQKLKLEEDNDNDNENNNLSEESGSRVIRDADKQMTRVKMQGEIAGKKGGKKGAFKHLVQKLKLEEDNDNDNEYINLSEESGSSRVIRDADKQMRRVKKQGEIAGKKGGKKGAFKHIG